MIGTLRKHQTWLWAFIITITIISFVVFFSPNANMDMFGGQPKYDLGSISGKPIEKEQYLAAQNEIAIFFRLRYREWPTDEMMKATGFNLEQETYNRIIMTEKLKELKIHISEDATAQIISDIFSAEDGKFSMERYEGFIKEIESRGFTKEDFERLARHEVGQQHLISLFGMSGKLMTPQEAEFLYRRDNELMSVDAVFFTSSNYLSKVEVNQTNVQDYFQTQAAQYRIPDRVVAEYVKFDATNFFAKADEELGTRTNVNQIAEAYYRQKGGTNFFKDDQGKGLSLDEAMPKIKEQFRIELAGGEARKQAASFITALFDYVQTNETDKAAFRKIAEAKNLTVQDSPPLDQQMMSKDLTLPVQFRNAALRLTIDEPYTTSPVESEGSAYVLALKQKIPGRSPEFKEVQEKVTEDYKMNEAAKLARNAGQKFAEELKNALAEGRTFESVCAAEKVKTTSLPTFSLSTRTLPELKDRLPLENLQNAAGRLAQGQSTDLMYAKEGGVVLYLRSRIPVGLDQLQRELPNYTRSMGDQRQYAAYAHWMQQQPEAMRVTLPARPDKK